MTPWELDIIIQGVPVYIRRQPGTGIAYATIHDFSKFLPKEEPLETIRIPVQSIPHGWDCEQDPV